MQTSLICLAVALIGGLMLSRLTKLLNLPAVTAYLVAGLLLGPFGLGRLQVPGMGFSSLEQVELMQEDGTSQLSMEDVRKLQKSAPNTVFHYSFEFYGIPISTTACAFAMALITLLTVLVFVMVFNYVISKFWIFKEKK